MDENHIRQIYENKNVAITGGLGMMGSSLAHKLVALGANVLLIDNYLEPYGANDANIMEIKDKVKINVADIRDLSSMNTLLKNQDFVFDFAAQVGHNISMKNPKLDAEINCIGRLNVLQACLNGSPHAKLIFSGSRFEFGVIKKNPVNEDHPLEPLSVYAIHKLAGEKYYLAFNRHYDMDTVVFRIANPYGPRSQMKHSEYGIVNWFLRLAMEGKDIPIFGDGCQIRDYIYISDLIDAFLAAGATDKSKGQVYNVGAGQGVKFIDMAKTIIRLVGKGNIIQVPWPKNYENIETGDYITDISKIKMHTGWSPKVSFEDGIKKTVEYYKDKAHFYWTN